MNKTDYSEGVKLLDEIIEEYSPLCLAFNGKKSWSQYLKHHDIRKWRVKYFQYGKQSYKEQSYMEKLYSLGKTTVFVLPSSASTSRTGVIQLPDNEKYWYELAHFIKDKRGTFR